MTPIRFLVPAQREAQDAREWYESQRPGLGDRFEAAVRRALDTIREMPGTWPLLTAEVRRYRVARFPYAVLYTFDATEVLVVAVMHLRRDPNYWRHRIGR